MITKEKATDLLHTNMQSQNLRKHCYAVGVVMKALAKHFHEDEDLWEVVGLLHDADYEKWPNEHPRKIIDDLEKIDAPLEITRAIAAHAWGYNGMETEPSSKLDWSVYCCDELTGLIVAVTLIRPDPPSHEASEGQGKKLKYVTVDDVLRKWNKKGFAKGVNRDNIALCEEKLGIKLNDFVAITLKAMQENSDELGL